MHNSVTPALAAILNQMTQLFFYSLGHCGHTALVGEKSMMQPSETPAFSSIQCPVDQCHYCSQISLFFLWDSYAFTEEEEAALNWT